MVLKRKVLYQKLNMLKRNRFLIRRSKRARIFWKLPQLRNRNVKGALAWLFYPRKQSEYKQIGKKLEKIQNLNRKSKKFVLSTSSLTIPSFQSTPMFFGKSTLPSPKERSFTTPFFIEYQPNLCLKQFLH